MENTPESGVREVDLQEKPFRSEQKDTMKGGGDSGLVKIAVVVVLLVVVAFLAFYFLLPSAMFVPGPEVDVETFKDIFSSADTVYIVMDVRGVSNEYTSTNILQCGVDFAGSSGMGGKTVHYLSISGEGCIAIDGTHPTDYCFDQLQKGVAIYIKEGEGGVEYYTNGMIVTVGPEYALGTCGIHRI